jgi:hypothetical protein
MEFIVVFDYKKAGVSHLVYDEVQMTADERGIVHVKEQLKSRFGASATIIDLYPV